MSAENKNPGNPVQSFADGTPYFLDKLTLPYGRNRHLLSVAFYLFM
jgi:hypothetical protein